MESNDCYKFSTIRNYIGRTGQPPVRTALDIGSNVGAMAQLMRRYFPQAHIYGFEPVTEYYEQACRNLKDDAYAKLFCSAISGEHLFEDDLGQQPRRVPTALRLFKGLPTGGPGWMGGSKTLPWGSPNPSMTAYAPLDVPIAVLTLDEAVDICCRLSSVTEIDYIKFDCEGSECSALGCASQETLRRIRFISGEYHELDRFYEVMRHKLYLTHYVNLVGESWGSFFCERKGNQPTILNPSRAGMLELRPWLCDKPVDWHPFREEFVLPEERYMHGLGPLASSPHASSVAQSPSAGTLR